MYKLLFNYLNNVDEFNEKLIIFVDDKKLASETLLIEAGLHEIKVEQYHILNNKYFLFGAVLMSFGFFWPCNRIRISFKKMGKVCCMQINSRCEAR